MSIDQARSIDAQPVRPYRSKRRLGGAALAASILFASHNAVTLELPSSPPVDQVIGVELLSDSSENDILNLVADGFGSMGPRPFSRDLPCTVDSILEGDTAMVHQAGTVGYDDLLEQTLDTIDQTSSNDMRLFGVSEGGAFMAKLSQSLLEQGETVTEITIVSTAASEKNIKGTNKFTRWLGGLVMKHSGYFPRFFWRLTKADEGSFRANWDWAKSAASTPKSVLHPQYELAMVGIEDEAINAWAENNVVVNYIGTNEGKDVTVDDAASFDEIERKYLAAGGEKSKIRYYGILDTHGGVTKAEKRLHDVAAGTNSVDHIYSLARKDESNVCYDSYNSVVANFGGQ